MKNKMKPFIAFTSTLLIILVLFIVSIIRTNIYNSKTYQVEFSGEKLFTSENDESKDVSLNLTTRSSTWGKIFDFDNIGILENNYEAHTYDIVISNNTSDEINNYKYKFIFSMETYLAQAWNGSLEIHQNVKNNEKVVIIPDLRNYDYDEYDLDYFEVEGEKFIKIYKDDYIIYNPSKIEPAIEVPVEGHRSATSGFISYIPNGTQLEFEKSSIIVEYSLYRIFTSDVFFWISFIGFVLWVINLIVVFILDFQYRKYNKRHKRDNEIINESIETFTGFIDAKDPYTNGHSKRVAMYTKLLAERMGFTGEELERIYYVALLHDCGKIGVPDNVLGKPGRLTDEEFEIIKSHTTSGNDILSSFKSLENAGLGAHYHHERYDGKGYPEGLAGENIPLIARIICVADSFDAMNSNRVYRKKLTKEYIINEIESNKGKQFDPKIADIMVELINEGKVKISDENEENKDEE